MIRILHVVSVMDMGGMENYIMNMYRTIDRTQFQFDFLVHHARKGVFEDEIERLGGHVWHTTLMDDFNVIKYCCDVNNIFKNHSEYRIVHGHLGSSAYLYLGIAKHNGVPWRILHSHCPGHPNTLKGYIKDFLFRFSPVFANVHLACSTEAGKYQFRKRQFEVVPNGIDISRFRFDESIRSDMRRKLGIEDKFVVGHVGRFYYEKNHGYLLKIFKKFLEKKPESVLMLIGDGQLMEDVKQQACELHLEESVLFMGMIQDCAPYYQAMDVFVLPSLYEGLPLTGIEAQCSGLPCIFSSTVSPEVQLDCRAQFLPIGDENADKWVDAISSIRRGVIVYDRRTLPAGADRFDAKKETEKMAQRYKSMWEQAL